MSYRLMSLLIALCVLSAPVMAAEPTQPQPDTTVKVKKLKGDIDGDGKLSKEEYLTPYSERFARIDTDKDGFVSPAEKKAYSDLVAAQKIAGQEPAAGDSKPGFLDRFFD